MCCRRVYRTSARTCARRGGRPRRGDNTVPRWRSRRRRGSGRGARGPPTPCARRRRAARAGDVAGRASRQVGGTRARGSAATRGATGATSRGWRRASTRPRQRSRDGARSRDARRARGPPRAGDERARRTSRRSREQSSWSSRSRRRAPPRRRPRRNDDRTRAPRARRRAQTEKACPRATPRPRLCHPDNDATRGERRNPNLKNTAKSQKTPPTTPISDSRLSSLPVSSQLRYRYLRRLPPSPLSISRSRVYPRTPTGRRHPSSLSFPRCDLARLGLFPQSGFGASNRLVAP